VDGFVQQKKKKKKNKNYVKHRDFDDLAQLLNLLLAPTDVAVRHIGFVLDLHHRDAGVDFGGKRDLDLVLLALDTVKDD